MMTRIAKPLALVLSLGLALSACGDEEGSEELGGPASVVPESAPIYVEVTVNPEGEQQEDLEALLEELGSLPLLGSVQDPGDLIIDQIDSSAAAAGVDFSFEDDVQPWLGEKAGLAVLSDSDEDSEDQFIAAVETTDEEATKDALDRILASDSVENEEAEYEGVTYFTSPTDNYAIGVFDDHLVLTTADDFEAAVDASASGESLAASDKVADGLAMLSDDRLAAFVVDLEGVEQFAVDENDLSEFEQAQEALPEFFDNAIVFGAGVTADSIFVDYAVPTIEGQPEVGETELLTEAPGDSIAAFGLEDVGSLAPPFVDVYDRLAEAGVEIEDYPAEGAGAFLEEETGVSVDDAAAAFGDGNLYVAGTLPDDVEVGGEILVEDEETVTTLLEYAKQQAEKEGEKVGEPVGGSDVGFSIDGLPSKNETAIQTCVPTDVLGPSDIEIDPDGDGCVAPTTGEADLPFVNIELVDDRLRYGFFKDGAAAVDSTAADEDGFGDTDAYAAAGELIGDDFELIGASDLQPIIDEAVPDAGLDDALLGGAGPEELVASFLADKIGVAAVGVRYGDGYSAIRYTVGLAE